MKIEFEFEFNVNEFEFEFEKRVIGVVSLSLLLSQTQRQHQGQLFWKKDGTKTTLPVCCFYLLSFHVLFLYLCFVFKSQKLTRIFG